MKKFSAHRNEKNSSSLHLSEIKISFEPLEGTPPELAVKMERLMKQARKGSIGIIGRLQKYIKKYPKQPALKNYLFLAYKAKNKDEEAQNVLQKTLEIHPDYLFGKINLAVEYLEKDRPEKVPEILGEHLDISLLYPDRDTFHFSEVLVFLHTVSRYFLKIREPEQAQERLDIMKQIAPNDVRVEDLEQEILMFHMEEMLERTRESQEKMISVESFPTVQFPMSDSFPALENDLLKAFYEYTPSSIPAETIAAIQQLERQSLIRDLERILIDSIQRFEWFRYEFEEFEEAQQSFQIHALYWLGALDAKDSLPTILNLLRQGEEFLDYWFSDQFIHFFLPSFYLLGESQLPVLKQFVLEPHLYCSARLLAGYVVEQVAHHQRSRQKEVEQWFEEVLQHHLKHPDDEGLIDTAFISWMISCMMNINTIGLIPLTEVLWNKDWIDPSMIGELEYIKEEMHRPHNPGDKEPMPQNIDEFYSESYKSRK
ncbi:MAG: hypothetical protein AAF985_07465 [Bacteroidota bacterium]